MVEQYLLGGTGVKGSVGNRTFLVILLLGPNKVVVVSQLSQQIPVQKHQGN